MPRFMVIGAGGVGSWLTPALCRMVGPKSVTVVDGDTLERGNLDRQLFTQRDLGSNKAQALARIYGCHFVDRYFSQGSIELLEGDWLLVCVDNHPARAASFIEADAHRCTVLTGANERTSAESYIYFPQWQGQETDPRIYYPDILTNHNDNPLAGSSGCTGEAAEKTPQLVSANMAAASLMMHMFAVWFLEAPKLAVETIGHLPYLMRVNMTRMEAKKVCEAK